MKQAINFSQFNDAFQSIRPDNFSYEGLRLLYDYFEAYAEDTGQEVDLDVIAICCEYVESSADEIIDDYGFQGFRESVGRFEDWRNYGGRENEELINELYQHTFVVGECENGNIVFEAY